MGWSRSWQACTSHSVEKSLGQEFDILSHHSQQIKTFLYKSKHLVYLCYLVYFCYTNQNILMVAEVALNKSTRLHYIESEIVIGVVVQLPTA